MIRIVYVYMDIIGYLTHPRDLVADIRKALTS